MGNRLKDVAWTLTPDANGNYSFDAVQTALLMDLRDELKAIRLELQRMNGVVQCSNTIAIPRILRAIQRNTAKPRVKKASR